MDSTDVIRDLASRPVTAVRALPTLTPAQLNAHPGGHPNSIAWLLWHSGREVDVQLADLTGWEQAWTRSGFRDRFGLPYLGDGFGLGHSPAEAASVVVEDQPLLGEYLETVLGEVVTYWAEQSPAQLDETVAEYDGLPVSRGIRLISLIDDVQQHVGAAYHVAGMLLDRPVGPA
ncbi:DinB family protein [Corynebacterium guangdongense]|uniref:DUF664 domain-containing protein n=1 Tax=Corynebacterium guangdongense TaxID=1783348 RepID=A0ABU1ZXL7_9CORY|nr:DinB family protein [Corynebacterium guangdongense]MDR7329684.1 hypothetical protein [Corynebacterium guangdongense]WJZ18248.1 DinB superfamily protein [Corynebacterium guangdongense]